MNLEKEEALIEAILFLESDPVDLKTILRITDFTRESVVQALNSLKKKYDKPDRGLDLVEIAGGYQLTPKSYLWEYLKARYGKKNENRLSRAAVETLSIIAYSQPVTKAEIENIRGVSADGMLKVLLGRKLIREVGKKDTPGKPVMYGTTSEFLTMFKLNSISDLPRLEDRDETRFELNA